MAILPSILSSKPQIHPGLHKAAPMIWKHTIDTFMASDFGTQYPVTIIMVDGNNPNEVIVSCPKPNDDYTRSALQATCDKFHATLKFTD